MFSFNCIAKLVSARCQNGDCSRMAGAKILAIDKTQGEKHRSPKSWAPNLVFCYSVVFCYSSVNTEKRRNRRPPRVSSRPTPVGSLPSRVCILYTEECEATYCLTCGRQWDLKTHYKTGENCPRNATKTRWGKSTHHSYIVKTWVTDNNDSWCHSIPLLREWWEYHKNVMSLLDSAYLGLLHKHLEQTVTTLGRETLGCGTKDARGHPLTLYSSWLPQSLATGRDGQRPFVSPCPVE